MTVRLSQIVGGVTLTQQFVITVIMDMVGQLVCLVYRIVTNVLLIQQFASIVMMDMVGQLVCLVFRIVGLVTLIQQKFVILVNIDFMEMVLDNVVR